ncbi:anti-sigma F factor [Thalassoglobus neptunius]|uniref:Anti-sigma F factor n=1 Tax=Thalassoglobus neptunius TaxID=1938619 RepID=A0A5C5WA15_9PLAN|nr:ATP-binding protein [Thalassoglobus neptunius]TWT47035.1 anti-sigma F factor [Thalassoglobus neptunius]
MNKIVIAGQGHFYLTRAKHALEQWSHVVVVEAENEAGLALELAHAPATILLTTFSTLRSWQKGFFNPLTTLSPATLVVAIQPLHRGNFSVKTFAGAAGNRDWSTCDIFRLVLHSLDPQSVCCQPKLVSNKRFGLHIDSDPAEVMPTINLIKSIVNFQNELNEEERIALEMGLSESLMNAIVHGNLEVSSHLKSAEPDAFQKLVAMRKQTSPYCDRKVMVCVDVQPDRFQCTITDEGQGFCLEDVDNPLAEENLSKPSGRGLLLMESSMDGIEWNSSRNEVTLTKYLGKNPSTGRKTSPAERSHFHPTRTQSLEENHANC